MLYGHVSSVGGPWILVVDDDGDNLEIFVETLQDAGFEARGMRSARQAIASLHDGEDRPCAILCDYRMPDMTGVEVARYVRQHPTLDGIAVMLLTASMPSAMPPDSGVPVLAKPCSPDELIRFVERHCPPAIRARSPSRVAP
jgi:CheY-like chemotaxis protein